MPYIVLLFFAIACIQPCFGQWMSINENGGNPDSSAALEIMSTDRGLLIPRMTEANRLAIPSPAQGLLVFQTDVLVGFYYHNGTAWDTLIGNTIINISNITTENDANIAVVRDIKGSGVDGGTFTSGSWETRDINNLQGDSSFISVDTNAFTLDSGIYQISAIAPARGVGVNQIRLYNTTTSTSEAVGVAVKAVAATSTSNLVTVIHVTSSSSFEIQHRCESTVNTTGFGEGVSWGENVYTQVTIQRL